jgi:hypothetical protein
MLTALLTFAGSKLGLVSAGAGLGALVLWAGGKYLPKYAGGAMTSLIGGALKNVNAIKDPTRKQLVHNLAVDLAKLAEYEIPDKGAGVEKYAKVAAQLCTLLPFLKGRDAAVEAIIENAVAAMDEELKQVK